MSASSLPPAGLLELSDVRVVYSGSGRKGKPVEALRGVSLSLERGIVTGLAGANGAGKTSLLELCVGALRPNAGQVTWFGETTWDASVRKRIGFCPDVPALPQRFTGREALHFYAALESMSTTEADARIDHLAERLKLRDALSQRVGVLSRGNLQRIGVCQALICKRDIILCDESFAPLDPVAQLDLRELLRDEAAAGAAVLVSSHQLDQLAKVADEILIMSNGVITRHLGRDAASAKQTIVLDISGLPSEHVSILRAAFPGAWCTDQVMRIPWANEFVDTASAHNALPSAFRTVPVIGVEAFSMEAVFLESVA